MDEIKEAKEKCGLKTRIVNKKQEQVYFTVYFLQDELELAKAIQADALKYNMVMSRFIKMLLRDRDRLLNDPDSAISKYISVRNKI
jgi:hypothetical protein